MTICPSRSVGNDHLPCLDMLAGYGVSETICGDCQPGRVHLAAWRAGKVKPHPWCGDVKKRIPPHEVPDEEIPEDLVDELTKDTDREVEDVNIDKEEMTMRGPAPAPPGTCPECHRENVKLRTTKHKLGVRMCANCISRFGYQALHGKGKGTGPRVKAATGPTKADPPQAIPKASPAKPRGVTPQPAAQGGNGVIGAAIRELEARRDQIDRTIAALNEVLAG